MMVALYAAMALLQAETSFTKTDRDVLLAFVKGNVKQGTQPAVMVHQWCRTNRFKLCDEVLHQRFSGDPLAKEFDRSLDSRAKISVRIDALDWGPGIRFFDLYADLQKVLRRSDLNKNFPGVDTIYAFNMPAYSSSGEHAIVYGWIGPVHIHSVHLISYLKRTKDAWKVEWTQYVNYL